jgi:hypothetical protein
MIGIVTWIMIYIVSLAIGMCIGLDDKKHRSI